MFGENLSFCSKNSERKRNSDKSRAITLLQISKMTGKNPNLDLVNMNACTVNPLYNDTVCSKLSLTLK